MSGLTLTIYELGLGATSVATVCFASTPSISSSRFLATAFPQPREGGHDEYIQAGWGYDASDERRSPAIEDPHNQVVCRFVRPICSRTGVFARCCCLALGLREILARGNPKLRLLQGFLSRHRSSMSWSLRPGIWTYSLLTTPSTTR